MGSISAMNSLDRVLKAHEKKLIDGVKENLPKEILDLKPKIELVNECYHIDVVLVFPSGSTLTLSPFDIETLAERFPDCKVGY